MGVGGGGGAWGWARRLRVAVGVVVGVEVGVEAVLGVGGRWGWGVGVGVGVGVRGRAVGDGERRVGCLWGEGGSTDEGCRSAKEHCTPRVQSQDPVKRMLLLEVTLFSTQSSPPPPFPAR